MLFRKIEDYMIFKILKNLILNIIIKYNQTSLNNRLVQFSKKRYFENYKKKEILNHIS